MVHSGPLQCTVYDALWSTVLSSPWLTPVHSSALSSPQSILFHGQRHFNALSGPQSLNFSPQSTLVHTPPKSTPVESPLLFMIHFGGWFTSVHGPVYGPLHFTVNSNLLWNEVDRRLFEFMVHISPLQSTWVYLDTKQSKVQSQCTPVIVHSSQWFTLHGPFQYMVHFCMSFNPAYSPQWTGVACWLDVIQPMFHSSPRCNSVLRFTTVTFHSVWYTRVNDPVQHCPHFITVHIPFQSTL